MKIPHLVPLWHQWVVPRIAGLIVTRGWNDRWQLERLIAAVTVVASGPILSRVEVGTCRRFLQVPCPSPIGSFCSSVVPESLFLRCPLC